MSFESLAKDPIFSSGFVLLNEIDDKKFVRLVDRMFKDFEPNRSSLFTEHELASIEKSLKLNSDQCQCILNCLNRLLKQVISDVIKPVVLKSVLSNIFSFNVNKVQLFCNCWTANAEQVVSRLQQNFTHFYRLKDVNWAIHISSNVGIELSDPEPRCLIEFKVEDSLCNDEHKTKEILLDMNETELKKFYDTLETIKVQINTAS
uniref:COMM domain-containing protein 10 n=1 Tax=Sipha flava TaxID=143950 RepID=A0A2S2QSC6_9HEMI